MSETCDVVAANELWVALTTALTQLPEGDAYANAVAIRDAWWTRESDLLWPEVA